MCNVGQEKERPMFGSQIRFAYETIKQVIHALSKDTPSHKENQQEWKSSEKPKDVKHLKNKHD